MNQPPRPMTRTFATWVAVGVAALAVLAGCDNPKSPDAAARDIARANKEASDKVASAEQSAEKDMNSDAYKVTMAQVDGDHKVQIEKCETLQGHDQEACKKQADADYEAAKANAKAAKVSTQP